RAKVRMMRCAFLLATLASGRAMATSVPPKPLAEMVAEADHVVVATVAVVDMVDGKGRPVLDRDARTGPGLDNQIRLHLAVSEVLRTDNVRLPKALVVPLWTAWHYSLGAIKDQVTGSSGIFLLKGNDFQPVYPARFQRSLEERNEIESLLVPSKGHKGDGHK